MPISKRRQDLQDQFELIVPTEFKVSESIGGFFGFVSAGISAVKNLLLGEENDPLQSLVDLEEAIKFAKKYGFSVKKFEEELESLKLQVVYTKHQDEFDDVETIVTLDRKYSEKAFMLEQDLDKLIPAEIARYVRLKESAARSSKKAPVYIEEEIPATPSPLPRSRRSSSGDSYDTVNEDEDEDETALEPIKPPYPKNATEQQKRLIDDNFDLALKMYTMRVGITGGEKKSVAKVVPSVGKLDQNSHAAKKLQEMLAPKTNKKPVDVIFQSDYDRLAAATALGAMLSRDKESEQQRLEQQRLEQQRLEQQRLEQQRLEQQRLEQQRLEQQRLEQQRSEQQRLEQQQTATLQTVAIEEAPGFAMQFLDSIKDAGGDQVKMFEVSNFSLEEMTYLDKNIQLFLQSFEAYFILNTVITEAAARNLRQTFDDVLAPYYNLIEFKIHDEKEKTLIKTAASQALLDLAKLHFKDRQDVIDVSLAEINGAVELQRLAKAYEILDASSKVESGGAGYCGDRSIINALRAAVAGKQIEINDLHMLSKILQSGDGSDKFEVFEVDGVNVVTNIVTEKDAIVFRKAYVEYLQSHNIRLGELENISNTESVYWLEDQDLDVIAKWLNIDLNVVQNVGVRNDTYQYHPADGVQSIGVINIFNQGRENAGGIHYQAILPNSYLSKVLEAAKPHLSTLVEENDDIESVLSSRHSSRASSFDFDAADESESNKLGQTAQVVDPLLQIRELVNDKIATSPIDIASAKDKIIELRSLAQTTNLKHENQQIADFQSLCNLSLCLLGLLDPEERNKSEMAKQFVATIEAVRKTHKEFFDEKTLDEMKKSANICLYICTDKDWFAAYVQHFAKLLEFYNHDQTIIVAAEAVAAWTKQIVDAEKSPLVQPVTPLQPQASFNFSTPAQQSTFDMAYKDFKECILKEFPEPIINYTDGKQFLRPDSDRDTIFYAASDVSSDAVNLFVKSLDQEVNSVYQQPTRVAIFSAADFDHSSKVKAITKCVIEESHERDASIAMLLSYIAAVKDKPVNDKKEKYQISLSGYNSEQKANNFLLAFHSVFTHEDSTMAATLKQIEFIFSDNDLDPVSRYNTKTAMQTVFSHTASNLEPEQAFSAQQAAEIKSSGLKLQAKKSKVLFRRYPPKTEKFHSSVDRSDQNSPPSATQHSSRVRPSSGPDGL